MSCRKEIGKISVKKCKFEWEIDNFFSYTEEDLILESPDCLVLDSMRYISIAPNGLTKKNSNGFVSLYLYLRDDEFPRTVEYRLGLKTVNNTIDYERIEVHTFDQFGFVGWGYPEFIKRSDLLQRKSELVPSDILTITCTVNSTTDLDSSYRKLAENLKDLFTSKSNTDVTLNVKEKIISVHKAILEARSPVFAAMFKNDMEEKKTGVVNIPDCDPDAFNVFLLFLYSGERDFTKCNIRELYKITDKYDVLELKLICVDFMTKSLSVENFGETLILADKFHEEELLTQVQNFFNENFENIFLSDNWECLFKENFRLANNLLKGMAPKVKLMK